MEQFERLRNYIGRLADMEIIHVVHVLVDLDYYYVGLHYNRLHNCGLVIHVLTQTLRIFNYTCTCVGYTFMGARALVTILDYTPLQHSCRKLIFVKKKIL